MLLTCNNSTANVILMTQPQRLVMTKSLTVAFTADDIKPGRCYEAKRPVVVGYYRELNDRQVKWVNSFRTQVQYDSPTVSDGRSYPIISMEKFLKWAGRDVTE